MRTPTWKFTHSRLLLKNVKNDFISKMILYCTDKEEFVKKLRDSRPIKKAIIYPFLSAARMKQVVSLIKQNSPEGPEVDILVRKRKGAEEFSDLCDNKIEFAGIKEFLNVYSKIRNKRYDIFVLAVSFTSATPTLILAILVLLVIAMLSGARRKIFLDIFKYKRDLKSAFINQLNILIWMLFIRATHRLWDAVFDTINPRRRTFIEGRYPVAKILVIEIDLIGDVVWATPVLRALRERYADAHIDFMIGSWCHDIVKNNPYIEKLIEFNISWFGDMQGNRGIISLISNLFKNLKTMNTLIKERYDLVIDLRGDPKTITLSFFTGAPLRIAYSNRTRNNYAAFLLTHPVNFSWDTCQNIHIVQHNLNLVETLGAVTKSKAPYIYTDQESEAKAERFLEEYGISTNDVLVGLHPGASRLQKLWKKERFAEVADKVIDKYGVRVVITGSPSEIGIALEIKALMRSEPIIASGKLKLLDFVSLLKRLALIITNETATISLASAVNTPVICLMSGVPALFGPYGVDSTVLLKELDCRDPIFEHCACNYVPYKCLNSIEPEEVLEAVDNHLRGKVTITPPSANVHGSEHHID